MANEEHLAVLAKGVSVWNKWRRNNPEIAPDLSGFDIQGTYLECANFERVNFKGANLSQCKLSWARFDGATLDEIKLDGADIVNSNFGLVLGRQKLAKERQAKLTHQSQETLKLYIQLLNSQNLEYPGTGVTFDNFSKGYKKSIEESLKTFICNGNDVVCIGYYAYEYGHCEMCGHHPIKWHYVLENLQNHCQMHVGSECIQNYQIILSKWGYRPEYIVFPNCLKPYTRWILDNNPHAVVFNDDIVTHFNKDCSEIIKNMEKDGQLKHYRYVERTNCGGVEKLIAINNPEHLDSPQKALTSLKVNRGGCPS